MSSIGKVTAKRTYSRVQEGPWASLSAMPEMYDYDVKLKKPRLGPTSATKPSVHPKICLSWLPPAPEEGYPIADPQSGMPGFRFRVSPSSPSQAAKTRSTSEPPSGLTVSPKCTGVAPSSLVETIAPARQPFNRRASVPYLSALPWPAPLAKEPTSPTTLPPLPLIRQDSISTTSTYFSNPPSLESDSIIGSTPASPTTSNSLSLSSDSQFIASTQQLIEFAKRTSLGGRRGEWSTEKKEILCAYFLGNSFPNMRQREGLGRQVGLETLQVSKFFSRTRSEVKYSRTTLRDLALQASFGLQFVGVESPGSSSSTGLVALPKASIVSTSESLLTPAPTPNIGRPPGRGRGSRGGRGGLGSNRISRLEVDPPSVPHPQVTPTHNPRVGAGNIHDSSNVLPLVQEPYHTGPVTSSVQEAARSLMSISSARFPVGLPALRGGPPPSPSVYAPDPQYEQTDRGGMSPELMRNISSSHSSCKTGELKSVAAPVGSRDEQPYLAYLSRTASLFGPDARTLPPPPSHGHPGSPSLSYPPTCPSGVRAASRATPADSLALAADLFLSANGICTFP